MLLLERYLQSIQIRSLKDLFKACDAIVFSKTKDHKFIFLKGSEPKGLVPDKKRTKGRPYIKNGRRLYDVVVDMYELPHIISGDNDPADVWVVDSLEQAQQQLDSMIRFGARQFNPKILKKKR
jgi:hypothetical protein